MLPLAPAASDDPWRMADAPTERDPLAAHSSGHKSSSLSKVADVPHRVYDTAKGGVHGAVEAGENVLKEAEKALEDRHFKARAVYLLLILVWTAGNTLLFKYLAIERVDADLNVCYSTTSDDPICPPVSFMMGLYFTVSTGLCIGYGTLTEKPRWKYWTMINSLVWLVFVAIFIGMVVSKVKLQRARQLFRRTTPTWKKTIIAFLPGLLYCTWLAIGTVFQMRHLGWEFERAFYFSFMTMCTGGQIGPGSMDNTELIFLVVYMVTGVPLFMFCIGFVIDSVSRTSYLNDVQGKPSLVRS
jgi:hypothetical protein